jgi:hypothetical protein
MNVCAQTRYLYGTRCEPLPPAPPTLAELGQEIAALRRRVAELEHWKIDRQAAHNALVLTIEQLARPGQAGEQQP